LYGYNLHHVTIYKKSMREKPTSIHHKLKSDTVMYMMSVRIIGRKVGLGNQLAKRGACAIRDAHVAIVASENSDFARV